MTRAPVPVMRDVADLAQVSHQTVSRVLNGHPGVRPQTRIRVLAAVDALAYRPNSAARALATGRSRTVGVVTVSRLLFGPMSMLDGVEEAARGLGYTMSIVSCGGTSAAELQGAVEWLVDQGVDGVIVLAPVHDAVEELARLATRVPLLTAGSAGLVLSGARLATQYLLDLGHPTVWHVAGPPRWLETSARIDGWRAALADAGIEAPPPLDGDWSARGGYEAGLLLAGLPSATAVFAANDQTALGLIRAFAEHGRHVPHDVSVVGFDDVPESGFFSPPLTTVRQDFAALGRQGLARLNAIIDGTPDSGGPPEAALTLVTRSTAGAYRGG